MSVGKFFYQVEHDGDRAFYIGCVAGNEFVIIDNRFLIDDYPLQ